LDLTNGENDNHCSRENVMPNRFQAVTLEVVKGSAVFALCANLILGQTPLPPKGIWGSESTLLAWSDGKRTITLPSPSGKMEVRVHDDELTIFENGRPKAIAAILAVDSVAEIAWAPDSKAFFVTSSDGGIVGTWSAKIYQLGKKVKVLDPTEAARNDFKAATTCQEEPNLAAVAWLKGSQELLLIGEVPPHSSCPDMGTFIGYAVSLPTGSIKIRLLKGAVLRDWGPILGTRFQNAAKVSQPE
jgi:hypothetical protein